MEGYCDGERDHGKDRSRLDNITNPDYRQAVEDYILLQTEGI